MANLFGGLEKLGFKNLENIELYAESSSEVETSQEELEVEEKEYIYEKNFACPVCGAKFKEKLVKKGKQRMIGSDSDLKPIYAVMNPVKYDVIGCNVCGYTATSRFFPKVLEVQKRYIKEKITPFFQPMKYKEVYDTDTAINRYKLALLNAVAKNSKAGEKAFICMKIVWLYRDKIKELEDSDSADFQGIKEGKVQEILFINQAYKGFIYAYENEIFPVCGLNEETVAYLIGEYARRIGKYDEALRWFSQVILNQNVNQRLKDRARTQKNLTNQLKKKKELQGSI